jgi:hypothetical protein
LAITGLKLEKQNLGIHLEFNSLSANIWFHGVSKYDEAVVTKCTLKKPPWAALPGQIYLQVLYSKYAQTVM